MSDDIPSILSHVSIGTNDFGRAVAFYDKIMPTLGCRRIMEHPGAVAYGKMFPEFWVQTPIDGGPAETANGVHIGFIAPSKEAVHAFHAAGLAAGASDDGARGLGPTTASPTTAASCAISTGTRSRPPSGTWTWPGSWRATDGQAARGAAADPSKAEGQP